MNVYFTKNVMCIFSILSLKTSFVKQNLCFGPIPPSCYKMPVFVTQSLILNFQLLLNDLLPAPQTIIPVPTIHYLLVTCLLTFLLIRETISFLRDLVSFILYS